MLCRVKRGSLVQQRGWEPGFAGAGAEREGVLRRRKRRVGRTAAYILMDLRLEYRDGR